MTEKVPVFYSNIWEEEAEADNPFAARARSSGEVSLIQANVNGFGMPNIPLSTQNFRLACTQTPTGSSLQLATNGNNP